MFGCSKEGVCWVGSSGGEVVRRLPGKGVASQDLFTPGPHLSVVRAVGTGQFHRANRKGWRESINF